MNEIRELIERFGFPTIVCLWFMWREKARDKDLRALTRSVTKLTNVCLAMAQTLDLSDEQQKRLEDSDRGDDQ